MFEIISHHLLGVIMGQSQNKREQSNDCRQHLLKSPLFIHSSRFAMSLYSLLLRRAALLPFSSPACCCPALPAQRQPRHAPHKVIVDMDIGDDIDDAFALALLLQSPDIEIIGITTAWGDTALRTRLLERFLRETGHAGIPVAQGTATANPTPFTQARYALRGQAPAKTPEDAASFIVREVARQPGQVTLLALGP